MAATAPLRQFEISTEKMDPVAHTILPLSPTASTHGGHLPQGFDELVHHNNATSFPREQVSIDAANIQPASERPEPRMETGAPRATASPRLADYGLSAQQQQPIYTQDYTYQSQPLYDARDGNYPSLLEESQPPYTTPASSPSQRSDVTGLRNSAAPTTTTEHRPIASKSSAPKPKRKKNRERPDKDKVILEKPLSEMGEEWKQSMIEIEAYINRPAEVRRSETDSDRKQPGRVKRPMNSFMLYRKAFQNHTKAYCEHNNHQVVSKVCGASWDMEPEHIRKQFGEWAKQERTNHQKAHPGYKFAPAKPNKAPKRKHDSDDDGSDLESYDWESGQRIKRARSHTSTPVPEHDLYAGQQGYYHQPPPQYAQHPAIMNSRNAMISSYGYNNPRRQMPAPYTAMTLGQAGQYLSTNNMPNQHYGQRGYAVEDISYHKTPSPGNQYHHPMQSALMEPYVTVPQQQRRLDHTSPPAHFMQQGRLGPGPTVYAGLNSGSFDPSDPLQLPDHAIETSDFDLSFDGNSVGHQGLGDGIPHDFGGESLLQDQQAQQLLRGNDESWDIQPLDEGQAGENYDEWGVDPSLSQPYSVNDPSLSEVFAAQD